MMLDAVRLGDSRRPGFAALWKSFRKRFGRTSGRDDATPATPPTRIVRYGTMLVEDNPASPPLPGGDLITFGGNVLDTGILPRPRADVDLSLQTASEQDWPRSYMVSYCPDLERLQAVCEMSDTLVLESKTELRLMPSTLQWADYEVRPYTSHRLTIGCLQDLMLLRLAYSL